MRTGRWGTASDAAAEPATGAALRRWALRTGLPVVVAGVVVAVMVSLAATSRGLDSCGPAVARPALDGLAPAAGADPGPTCHDLVRSLSMRTGVGVGLAAVFLLAFVMGLQRTATVLERDRGRWPAPLGRR